MFQLKNYKSISEREDETTGWWKENKIFEKSQERRPESNRFSFLDGPPFVTGLPHYASLLPRMAKDIIPRFKTMQGYKVRHVWGWDCHGLPIEEKTEKKVGLKNRREIEKFGINKFIESCRSYVNEVSSEWEWYVDKIAEWVDFKGAYKTMDEDYMESVIWVFKELYDKGLIYEGVKTLLYCTRCGTPISKFEIAMDDSYADMEDPAITIEFPITTKGKFQNARMLAWTTTPWTLPSNRALVVDPKEVYVEFKMKAKRYIAAKKRLTDIVGENECDAVKEFKGKELIGLSYKAPYNYFAPNEHDFKVYEYAGMVTMEEGTGIVHSAPGFGEVDTEMGKHYGLTMMFSVDDEGKFIPQVKDFAGVYVKKADPEIIKNLEKRNILFKSEKVTHRYPYCYRCQTPLIQKAQQSWFINIQKIKPLLLKQAEKINWTPKSMGKRFINNIKDAPDWCISRTRYWATAMPIWKCSKCGEVEVFGSKNEIEMRSGDKVYSLHRNGVDHIKFKCKKCNGEVHRIPEVLDCWMESGSMPFGQIHYPFENKDLFKKTFPADYIVEYVAQIRAWFYCMHVIANALMGENSFKNVVVTGVLWGTDGRKMSKSFGNYPDPKDTLIRYGGDALRLYFFSSPIMVGEDMNFNEEDLRDRVKTVIFPLWNSLKYFATYANLYSWKPVPNYKLLSTNYLDRWILARLKQFQSDLESSLNRYEIPTAAKTIAPFINDLSTWYIRRSRDRFSGKGNNELDQKAALTTLYHVLVVTAEIIAPIAPFITESIYEVLVKDQFKNSLESVHLCDWPKLQTLTPSEKKLIKNMEVVRKVASLGQAARIEAKIKVRQPLGTLKVSGIKLEKWMADIVRDELNVKAVESVRSLKAQKGWVTQKEKTIAVALDTTVSEELKQEGLLRELVRTIQATRKKLGFKLEDKVKVVVETSSKELQSLIEKQQKLICKQSNSKSVELGKGEKEVKVNEFEIKLSVTK